MEMVVSVPIVGGVVLILAMVMVTTTVLIYLRARARRKQTQNVCQVGSNGSRGLEGPDDAFPVYSTPYSHKADCSDVTDQQMMMQSNPAYMSTTNQGKANQSFSVEKEECRYETVGGINTQVSSSVPLCCMDLLLVFLFLFSVTQWREYTTEAAWGLTDIKNTLITFYIIY